MSDDAEYVNKRLPKRVYFSSEFKALSHVHKGRPMRFAYQVVEAGERERFAQLKEEVVIRTGQTGRQQIKARFFVDDRGIDALVLQRFSGPDFERPSKETYFSLRGDEIQSLLNLALLIRTTDFNDGEKARLDVEDLQNIALTPSAVRSLLSKDVKLIAELAKHEVLESDVMAVAYRRRELERFRRLMEDPEYFQSEKEHCAGRGPESVWQNFFEQNPWIFGYGLFYVFTTSLDDAKLEQMVIGSSVTGAGKKADALLRTRGIVSSLCFAEIKTHETPLLQSTADPYRPDAWAVSKHLAGAIAQVQKTVEGAERAYTRRFEPRSKEGDPTGERLYVLRPRSIVVAGSLGEFKTPNGINEVKFSSFELFRRQLNAPEILTFDELYERARFIVESAA